MFRVRERRKASESVGERRSGLPTALVPHHREANECVLDFFFQFTFISIIINGMRERERLDDEGEEGEEGEEGGRKKSLKSAPCKRRMGWNGVEWGGVGWSGLYYSFFGCYHA